MVSNKNRKTKYQHVDFHRDAVKEFESCKTNGETNTDTLLKLIKTYKSKCLGHKDQGICVAD